MEQIWGQSPLVRARNSRERGSISQKVPQREKRFNKLGCTVLNGTDEGEQRKTRDERKGKDEEAFPLCVFFTIAFLVKSSETTKVPQ